MLLPPLLTLYTHIAMVNYNYSGAQQAGEENDDFGLYSPPPPSTGRLTRRADTSGSPPGNLIRQPAPRPRVWQHQHASSSRHLPPPAHVYAASPDLCPVRGYVLGVPMAPCDIAAIEEGGHYTWHMFRAFCNKLQNHVLRPAEMRRENPPADRSTQGPPSVQMLLPLGSGTLSDVGGVGKGAECFSVSFSKASPKYDFVLMPVARETPDCSVTGGYFWSLLVLCPRSRTAWHFDPTTHEPAGQAQQEFAMGLLQEIYELEEEQQQWEWHEVDEVPRASWSATMAQESGVAVWWMMRTVMLRLMDWEILGWDNKGRAVILYDGKRMRMEEYWNFRVESAELRNWFRRVRELQKGWFLEEVDWTIVLSPL